MRNWMFSFVASVSAVTASWIFGMSASNGQTQPVAGASVTKPAVTGLSDDELQQLAAGKGMSQARAAELNGYPGPMHVLDIADKLHLTDNQRTLVQAVERSMRQEAIRLGKEVIDAERILDELYAAVTAADETVRKQVMAISQLRAELRMSHLRAHKDTRDILTKEQLDQYPQLRGYRRAASSLPNLLKP